MISAIGSDFGVEHDKTVDPEEVAEQLDDVVGTFYTLHTPSCISTNESRKMEGK